MWLLFLRRGGLWNLSQLFLHKPYSRNIRGGLCIVLIWLPGSSSLSWSVHVRSCGHAGFVLHGELGMGATVAAPLEWVESVSDLRLPSRANERLQQLMDRNTDD